MKLPRRQFLHLDAGAGALPAMSHIASALDYPMRPVHLIAGFPPGGIADISARLIGQWLSERLGQQFVIENRAGVHRLCQSQSRQNHYGDRRPWEWATRIR
jgi:hypothetical protein